MRAPILCFLLLVPGLFFLNGSPAQAQFRVLVLGNSFDFAASDASQRTRTIGGVPAIFERLARAGGHTNISVVLRAVGGQDFEFHDQDPTSQQVIASQPWDYVITHTYSTEPTHFVDAVHSIGDYLRYGENLYLRIMTNNARTKIVLTETWSRAVGHPFITGVSNATSFTSTAEFQTELRLNYLRLANLLNEKYPTNPPVVVAPVGDAWENAGGLLAPSAPGYVSLFASDLWHGNDNGHLLYALVLYCVIYRESPLGLSSNPLITNLQLALTVSPGYLEAMAWATVRNQESLVARSLLFDFGADGMPTTHGPPPDDPSNYWNHIGAAVGGVPSTVATNLVTHANELTKVGLYVVDAFSAEADLTGSLDSVPFPPNAARSSLLGHTEEFNGRSNVFPAFKLTGLNPAGLYSFTFFASLTNVAENCETSYRVTGTNSGQASLNPAGNTHRVAQVRAIGPDEAGEIVVRLTPTTNNISSKHFTLLGVMKVDIHPPQEPLTLLRSPSDQLVYESQPVSFSALVLGSPPFFVSWTSNGVLIPDANQFTYTIPATTVEMSGAEYAVTVSNFFHTVSSTNARLSVVPSPLSVPSQRLLLDFGGATTTETGSAPDDPLNRWNNIPTSLGTSPTGQLSNLVTTSNKPTSIALQILSRFANANENGTLSFPFWPQDATRDALYGNTEFYSGLSNVFPKFKLTGLNPALRYDFSFYASRMGVSDNRETGYTVEGLHSGFAALNPANNVSNVAVVRGISPNPAGEITVAIGPTTNNNNANHFTYLGIMSVTVIPALLTPVMTNETVILQWLGEGQLEWSPTPQGPWTSINPPPNSPYSQPATPGSSRFFRLRAGL